MRNHSSLLPFLLLIAFPLAANAAEPAKTPDVSDREVKTEHSVRIQGDSIDYTATTGTMVLRDDKGEPKASFFYIAYTRDDVRNPEQRPVTFTFNGGPGSSSVWLHLGTFGPKRVAFEDAEQPEPAPYRLVDNAESLLDVTDLVFIDPVGTGYSRAEGETDPKEFYGVDADRKSVGEFIRLWTTRNQRWNSPKFLAGESYGTTRAAAVVSEMQNRGMFFNGVILVSSILNFQTARFETGNDLPYPLFLPTYAATAWYHGQVDRQDRTLESFLDEVRAFADGEYTLALMQGSELPAGRQQQVAARLAQYTGLDAGYIVQNNLRVPIFRFVKELLRDQRRTVGRLDSRYTGIDSDAAGERFEHDPSYTAITGPYTAALNDYLRDDLGFEEDREYQILSFTVNMNWDWDTGRAGYVNVAEDLRRVMSTNTHLKVHVANGYYDLATPFHATEYTMDHLGLEPELRDNIEMSYYPAGHMMYIHPESLEKLNDNIREFIRETVD